MGAIAEMHYLSQYDEGIWVHLLASVRNLIDTKFHEPELTTLPILQKAEETGNELNRAVRAALNAELR